MHRPNRRRLDAFLAGLNAMNALVQFADGTYGVAWLAFSAVVICGGSALANWQSE